MMVKTLAAAALAMTMAAPALAVPVEVDLVIDLERSGSTTIVTLFGLDNGIRREQAATSYSIQTASDFYGPFSASGQFTKPSGNSFTFIPGGNFPFDNLLELRFELGFALGNNDAPFFTREIDRFSCGGQEGDIRCSYFEDTFTLTDGVISGGKDLYFGFADVVVRELVAPVPLPAGGVLLLSALAGAAALKRRKTVAA